MLNARSGEGAEPERLYYSYYTAGTGGVGPTILETSFLLAGEPVLAYKEGKQFSLPPVSERRCVDFGPGIGKTGCFLYNLPEVKTAFEVLCSSRLYEESCALGSQHAELFRALCPRSTCR